MNVSCFTGSDQPPAIIYPAIMHGPRDNVGRVAHQTRVVDWDALSGHTFDGVYPDAVGKTLLAQRERQVIETC